MKSFQLFELFILVSFHFIKINAGRAPLQKPDLPDGVSETANQLIDVFVFLYSCILVFLYTRLVYSISFSINHILFLFPSFVLDLQVFQQRQLEVCSSANRYDCIINYFVSCICICISFCFFHNFFKNACVSGNTKMVALDPNVSMKWD